MSMNKKSYSLFPMLSMRVGQYVYQVPYLYRKWLCPERTFNFRGQEYKYFLHPYNTTWRNERCVELPLAIEYLQHEDPRKVLEVGNVLSHYIRSPHIVVDKYERGGKIIAQDIVTYRDDRSYELVLCISTLEHIGFDEKPKEPRKYKRAIQNMFSLLSYAGKLIVTIPIGYNPEIDTDLWSNQLGFDEYYYFKRIGPETWKQSERSELKNVRYGVPYRAANGLAICIGYSRSS